MKTDRSFQTDFVIISVDQMASRQSLYYLLTLTVGWSWRQKHL